MDIEIKRVDVGGNEFGVGVGVRTTGGITKETDEGEGATWVGICLAINDYMRSRGSLNFDCMKKAH